MLGVPLIDATQFNGHSVTLHCRMDPSAGLFRLKDVRDGGQVNQMKAALVPGDTPAMSVAEDVRLYVSAGTEDSQQFGAIFEAAASLARREIAALVMDHDNGGLSGI